MYKIEARYFPERSFFPYTVFIRRPMASSIAIGVGCGSTLAKAICSAREEVRLRRRAGEFRAEYCGSLQPIAP